MFTIKTVFFREAKFGSGNVMPAVLFTTKLLKLVLLSNKSAAHFVGYLA